MAGRHWHVNPCLHVKNRSRLVPVVIGNGSKHAPICRSANGYTRSQRRTLVWSHDRDSWGLLSALRRAEPSHGPHPAMASGRRGPAMRQKGIASDGQIYRSSVLSEREQCPKSTGVRTAPPQTVLAPIAGKGTKPLSQKGPGAKP
jgi:hypothetical protein